MLKVYFLEEDLGKVCPKYFVYDFLGGPPTSICHFFPPFICLFICPSVRPSVMHHISGTVHHVIIILGTCL